MAPIMFNSLIFLFIPIGLLFVLGSLIYFHLKRYGMEGDSTKKIIVIFPAFLIILSLLMIIIFISIDWNKASIDDFSEKSKINLYSQPYEQ